MAIKLEETDDLQPVGNLFERMLGYRPSRPTIWRWRTTGCRGVRLEMVLAGSRWMSSARAVAEFVRAMTAAGISDPHKGSGKGIAAANAARKERTRRRLEEAGLLSKGGRK